MFVRTVGEGVLQLAHRRRQRLHLLPGGVKLLLQLVVLLRQVLHRNRGTFVFWVLSGETNLTLLCRGYAHIRPPRSAWQS